MEMSVKYLCGVFLGRAWALNYLLFLVLRAAAEVPDKVLLNRVNKDKSFRTFFFSRSAGSVCKSLLGNIV